MKFRVISVSWMRSGNGTRVVEAGIVVTKTDSDYGIVNLPNTNEAHKITFKWDLVPENAIALVHTHGNQMSARPSDGDKNLINSKLNADLKIPIYTLSNRGMYVYQRNAKDHEAVPGRENLDWQKQCKKD